MNTRGFSLIETIAVIAILSVVSIVLTNAIVFFYKSNRQALSLLATQSAVATGIDSLTHSLIETSYGDDGAYPLAEAASSSIAYFANVDSDTALERVHWYIQNGTLIEATTKSLNASYAGQSEKIQSRFYFIQNASSTPLFRYFASAGTELSDPVDISKVTSVEVALIAATSSTTPQTFTLSRRVSLRFIPK